MHQLASKISAASLSGKNSEDECGFFVAEGFAPSLRENARASGIVRAIDDGAVVPALKSRRPDARPLDPSKCAPSLSSISPARRAAMASAAFCFADECRLTRRFRSSKASTTIPARRPARKHADAKPLQLRVTAPPRRQGCCGLMIPGFLRGDLRQGIRQATFDDRSQSA